MKTITFKLTEEEYEILRLWVIKRKAGNLKRLFKQEMLSKAIDEVQ